jgi:hypothetical protein
VFATICPMSSTKTNHTKSWPYSELIIDIVKIKASVEIRHCLKPFTDGGGGGGERQSCEIMI